MLAAFESGALLSIATKDELEQIRESARATATKDQRINIRLSAGDLRDIQVRAMQEGMPLGLTQKKLYIQQKNVVSHYNWHPFIS